MKRILSMLLPLIRVHELLAIRGGLTNYLRMLTIRKLRAIFKNTE